MVKEELIQEIRTAFKDVKLEDGVGLWEAQGIDDSADQKTILDLRRKDERKDWEHIPYKDIELCESSLSFFDAKGMRFCLPKFLIFDLLEEQLNKEQDISSPDVIFTLGYKLNEEYQLNRFSLLNNQQILSIIHYLEYKLQEIRLDAVDSANEYIELSKTLNVWKQKLK